MNKRYFDRLVNEYGQIKARKALAWFCENHSESFRKAINNPTQFCIDNELLWNC